MYGKLFASMYDGSLAMVGPWEALVTFQQLIVLADREGFVDMTPEAISRRTIIPIEIIRKGLAVLESPDPQSRDPMNEGRRIERISEHREWGWKILNYAKYRQIRTADERREYMREYMREKRGKPKPPLPQSFEVFWAACPRKVGKGAAERAWLKINPDEALAMQIVKAMNEQRTCEQWTRDGGKFIPHPATWLNRKGWEDEIGPVKGTRINKHGTVEGSFGRCKYCEREATRRTNGIAHCEEPRHLDNAIQGA